MTGRDRECLQMHRDGQGGELPWTRAELDREHAEPDLRGGRGVVSEPPYVKDPLNPTDAELSAAIQRGLENGTLLTVEQFMQKAAELDQQAEAEPEPEIGE